MKRWLEAAAASGMFGFGLVMALLGAVLPLLAERLNFQLASAGDMFLAMNAAMLIVTIATGPLLDRFGTRPALLIAPVLSAAAVSGIALAGSYAALVAAGIALGFGGGVLNAATNMLVADLYEDPREKNAALNRLGVWFGVGAVFLPFSVGTLLSGLCLTRILLVAAGLSLAPSVLSAILRFPAPKQAGGVPLSAMLGLARNPLVLAFAFLLFFQSGNEFVLSGYMTTFLTTHTGVSIQTASYVLAGYWVAVMTSRVLLSRLLLKWNGSRVVLLSAFGVMASVLLLVSSASLGMAVAAILLLGLCISPIFPTTLGVAGTAFAAHSGTVFGFLIAVALCGGMTQPWIVGHAGQSFGLRYALLAPVLAAGGIALLQTWIARRLPVEPEAK